MLCGARASEVVFRMSSQIDSPPYAGTTLFFLFIPHLCCFLCYLLLVFLPFFYFVDAANKPRANTEQKTKLNGAKPFRKLAKHAPDSCKPKSAREIMGYCF